MLNYKEKERHWVACVFETTQMLCLYWEKGIDTINTLDFIFSNNKDMIRDKIKAFLIIHI